MNIERDGIIYQEEFDRDTWETPDWLFRWQNEIYDFHVDLCASKDNAKCDNFFSEEKSALNKDYPWVNYGYSCGWSNPPYSKPEVWVKECSKQSFFDFTSVMLIPTPNGEKYYKRVFDNAHNVTIIEGRIGFIAPVNFYTKNKKGEISYFKKGQPVPGNTRGSCVVDFSPIKRRSGPRFDYVIRDKLISEYN